MNAQLSEIKQLLITMQVSLNAKDTAIDDRVRALEVNAGSMKMLGILFSIIIGPGLALIGTLLIWHRS